MCTYKYEYVCVRYMKFSGHRRRAYIGTCCMVIKDENRNEIVMR